MNIPDGLRYTSDHEWARTEQDGTITCGITDFAQAALGGVVFVELPDDGAGLAQGDRFGTVESTKSVSDLYAPVAGLVVARNSRLDAEPELVNTDPYGDGWMVRLRPDGDGDLARLMDAAAYGTHVAAADHG
ncbi:MAG: glycine cleavage system protein GcvH [Myxococcales bacterium]|nr:glycine cleavage system protein GcvH [Myxococcales bacterium]